MGWVEWQTFEVLSQWFDLLRSQSRQMEELLAGDYSSLDAEIRAAFPETDGLVRSPVDLVGLYTTQMSGRYVRGVTRSLPAGSEAIGDVYARTGFDLGMHAAERALLGQQQVVRYPVVGASGLPDWRTAPVWRCEATFADASDSSMRGLSRLRILEPVTADETMLRYGDVILTPTLAYREAGGQRVPLFGGRIEHPWPGEIPALVIRAVDSAPMPGRWWCPVDEALLVLAIQLCLDESDLRLIAHHQAWGQKYIAGLETGRLGDDLLVGPEKWLNLPAAGATGAANPSAGIVQSQPPIAELGNWKEARIRMFAAARGLAADALLKHNTSATMAARELTRMERAAIWKRSDAVWRQAELEHAIWTARVYNVNRIAGLIAEPAGMGAYWAEGDGYGSSVERMQALDLEVKAGVTTVVTEVAQREGLSLAAAESRVRNNLALSRSLGDGTAAVAA